jgi:hypothetical protein
MATQRQPEMSADAIYLEHDFLTPPETKRMIFSLRYIKYFFLWLVVWQDNSLEGAPLQFYTYLGRSHSIRPIEMILLAILLIFIIERTLLGDFTIKRSYFSGPIILLAIALFISYVRGEWINQHVTIPYEMHEAPEIILDFFLFVNLFRDPKEARTILLIFLFATIFKALDGVTIYFFSHDPQKGWGVLYIPRDGFLIALGLVGTLLLFHYRGIRYRILRWVFFISSPLLLFTLIVSFRRAFIIAFFVSAIVMFWTLPRGRKWKHGLLLFSMVVVLAIIILATDPIGFIGRISGIFDPSGEGSAYIRLMEYPNVIQNIIHNPIFGTAIDTQWHEYFRMPVYANFTTLGTHNSYLYWPLRTGILGSAGFVWLLFRAWKFVLLEFRAAKTEEELLIAQICIQLLVIFQVGCFFSIMFADGTTCLLAIMLVGYQLLIRARLGQTSLKNVLFFESYRKREYVFKSLKPGIAI